MNEILDLATKLGKLMAAHPHTKSMCEARAALDESIEDRQLVSDYEAARQKLGELEQQQKPIEPEDKRNLADLHAKIAGSEVVKALMKAQVDYTTLMSTVSQRIEQEATRPISKQQ